LTPGLVATAPALTSGELVVRLLVQLATGLALGYLVMVAVSAVQAAGDLIDLVGGFNSSIALDPLMLTQTSVFGRLHQFVAVTILFVTDGHLMIVHGLSRSLQAMPDPRISWQALGDAVVSDVSGLVTSALQIAAPIIAAMLVADVSLGLLTRAAPALNAFALAFPLKILFSLLLVGFVVAELPSALHDLVEHAVLTVQRLSGAGAGGG
jgi:flagellar biosynthetic protein FliR